jgi:hypothetical protein
VPFVDEPLPKGDPVGRSRDQFHVICTGGKEGVTLPFRKLEPRSCERADEWPGVGRRLGVEK